LETKIKMKVHDTYKWFTLRVSSCQDKINHAFFGCFLFLVLDFSLGFLTSYALQISFMIVVIVAVIKELFDKKYFDKEVSILDILATLALPLMILGVIA
jgi:hypothetical protein